MNIESLLSTIPPSFRTEERDRDLFEHFLEQLKTGDSGGRAKYIKHIHDKLSLLKNNDEFKNTNFSKIKATPIINASWEAHHLYQYAKYLYLSSDPNYSKELDSLIKKYKIPHPKHPEGMQKSVYDGWGGDTAKKIFFVLAQVQKKSLLACLSGFLKYCHDYNRPLSFFDPDRSFFEEYIRQSILQIQSSGYKSGNLKLTLELTDGEKAAIKKYYEDIDNFIQLYPDRAKPDADCKSIPINLASPKFTPPFSDLITRLKQDAIYERKDLIDDISKAIEQNNSGYILLKGGAGTGKSSVLAHLIDHFETIQKKCIWHFNIFGHGKNSTLGLIDNLHLQLKNKYSIDCGVLTEKIEKGFNSTEDYRTILHELLAHISATGLSAEEPLIILVDALDEVTKADFTTNKDYEGNWLTLPIELPQYIHIVVSSRDFSGQLFEQSRAKSTTAQFNLDDKEVGSYQYEDIRNYIKLRWDEEDTQNWVKEQTWSTPNIQDEFIELFCDKSEYTFIYLFHIFNDIKSFEHTQTLPQGLRTYFRIQYQRLKKYSAQDNTKIKLILAGLAKFEPTLSYTAIAAYANIDEPLEISNLLDSWDKARLIYTLFYGEHAFVRFFHLSFYDFLNDPDEEPFKDLRQFMNSNDAHKRLSTYLNTLFIFQDDKFVLRDHLTEHHSEEIFRVLLEVLFKSKSYDSAKELLSNLSFCSQYLKYCDADKIIRTAMTFHKKLSLDNGEDAALSFLENLMANISPKQDALIPRKNIERIAEGRSTLFYDHFIFIKKKERIARRKIQH